jgi:protein associated with RNAse G/E
LISYRIGDKFQIQCYKHDGKPHRAWDEAILLDIKDDYLVFGNNRSLVTEAEGSVWRTKEPAIMYFFKDEWFNVITQLKKDGMTYYCNIATPYIIEDKTIKYIDYDLDLRIFSNGTYKILDAMEYKYHKKTMSYSDDLDMVINGAMKRLINIYKDNNQNEFSVVFDKQKNLEYYNLYKEYKER